MTKQEYTFIRNLAWDLLIDSNTKELPVNVYKIAEMYDIKTNNQFNSRFDHMMFVADKILTLYGLNSSHEYPRYLTVRVLAPMIVLRKLDIKSSQELMHYTELPENLARQRYDRYCELTKRDSFCKSQLEVKVLRQFSHWISSVNPSSS